MINTKAGTQTWSPVAQQQGLEVDRNQQLSVGDREKALGGQAVGDIANKVADQNWVDPEKTKRVGGSNLDKDAFLKLMLAQMKYQDPTNPMQNHEMAAQLAQFTSLEQLNNINTTLTGMSKTQQPQTNYQALNFIGKRVSGDSSKLTRMTGDTNHEFNFELGNDSSTADVKVLDADGNQVRKLTMVNLKKGPNSIQWNGMSDDGASARPGDYHFAVEAVGTNGSKVFAKTEFNGKITGLNYTPQGPILLVGQQAIRMSDVRKIEESSQQNAAPQMMQQQGIPLGAAVPSGAVPGMMQPQAMHQQVQAAQQQEAAGTPAKDPSSRDQMVQNIAMSRAVLDQVAKAKAAASGLSEEKDGSQ